MIAHLKTYFTHTHSVAVGCVFASMGFLFGNWVTLIPYVKAKFDLDDAQLGLLLLSMPFASTVSNPLAAYCINRFGMRHTTIGGMILMALAYLLPVNMPTLWFTALTLGVVGISIAITNIAMNTCVTAIEKHEGIHIMSTSHGMFSIGGMIGSALASTLIGLEITPFWHTMISSSVVAFLGFMVSKHILTIHEERLATDHSTKFIFPTGVLLGMVCIAVCTNITEGVMADWTAVYMRDVVKTNKFYIGWGFASYALLMALGRFMGDSFIPRYGRRKLLVTGGVMAAIGIGVAVLLPYTFPTIIGFGLVGLGVSSASPILYGSASRIPNMAKGAGLATLNTFSISGFLIGPALIGFISEAFSLSIALSIIAVLAILWATLSNRATLY